MNIFVLCTGRCGSVTFTRACGHASNYTAGHETRSHLTGAARLAYPDQHIEADNRLSFILGRLEEAFGDRARYVHLIREREPTVASYARRIDRPKSLAHAWHMAFLMRGEVPPFARDVCGDLYDSIVANIRLFLRDKDHRVVRLEEPYQDFPRFWSWANLTGNLDAAMKEWSTKHNASKPPKPPGPSRPRPKPGATKRPRLSH